MSQQEEQLYALMAVAEQQQQAIDQAIRQLEQTKKQILEITAAQTQHTVDIAIKNGLQQGTEQLINTARQLHQLHKRIDHSLDSLSWKLISIGLAIFLILVIGLMGFLAWYVPSLDEIQQRRADVKKLEPYALQLRESKNGETLVRIMTKKCYSYEPNNVEEKTYDWCEIDPKKY